MRVGARPTGRRPLQWFDLRGRRGIGLWAFAGMRLSGIALVIYLAVHLTLLQQLADGPTAWDSFIALSKSPVMLLGEVLLIAAVVGHGLNGLRVALIGFGIGVPRHKVMLAAAALVAAVLTAASAYALFFWMR